MELLFERFLKTDEKSKICSKHCSCFLTGLLDCLENDPRTYNSKQLAHKLKQERGVDLSGDRLRRILKKRVIDGNELGQVIEQSKTQ